MAPLKMKFQLNMLEWYSSPQSFAIHFISMELTAVTSVHTEKYSVQPFLRCFTDSAAVLPTIINILTDTVPYSTMVLCMTKLLDWTTGLKLFSLFCFL